MWYYIWGNKISYLFDLTGETVLTCTIMFGKKILKTIQNNYKKILWIKTNIINTKNGNRESPVDYRPYLT